MAETTKETNENTTKDSKKSKKGLIIGCVVAAVVLIVAIIALVVINPFKKANMVGKYDLTSLVADGEEQTSSLELMKAFGLTYEIEITDDKNGKMNVLGEEINFTYDGKQFHFEMPTDEDESTETVKTDSDYTFKDDKITLKYNDSEMVFSKKNN